MADGMGNRHREYCVGFLTDRMGMGDRGILSCPLGHVLQIMFGSEDAERADPHHRPVGLAFLIEPSPQTARNGHAAIEGPRVQPEDVGLPGFRRVVSSLVHQHSGQQQRHFRIVSRLSRNRVPGSPVGKFPDAVGKFRLDLFGGWNSTRLPSASPTSCPRRQPCARGSASMSTESRHIERLPPFNTPIRPRGQCIRSAQSVQAHLLSQQPHNDSDQVEPRPSHRKPGDGRAIYRTP